MIKVKKEKKYIFDFKINHDKITMLVNQSIYEKRIKTLFLKRKKNLVKYIY
jgi:hypothetical protein